MINKQKTKTLWIAAAGSILAWPVGKFVGLVLAASQDAPGIALAQTFGAVATTVVWGISAAVVIWNWRKAIRQLGKFARAAVFLSITILPAVAILSTATHQVYDLRVWNKTGAKIDKVSVQLAGNQSEGFR